MSNTYARRVRIRGVFVRTGRFSSGARLFGHPASNITRDRKQAMDSAEKARKNRIRRMARRQSLELVKSRRRDPQAWDYGTYQLINPKTKIIALQRFGWRVDGTWGGVGLDEVEQWLTTTKSVRIDSLSDDQLEELHLARYPRIGDNRH
jgi:hypothetical protein